MKIPTALRIATAVLCFSILPSCDESNEKNNSPRTGTPVKTEKGTPTGEVSTSIIGNAGGTLTSADGRLTVVIPEGALASNTTISIQPVTNEGPLGLGFAYRLEPAGVTFAEPVKLEFKYDDSLLGQTPEEFLWIVSQANDLSWNAMLRSAVDPNTKTVVVDASHFSDWALGRFIDLSVTPKSSTLLKGKSVDLHVAGFVRDQASEEADLAPLIPLTGDGDELTPLSPIPPVESRLMDFKVKRWTLNGTAAPVSNSNGLLTANGVTAKFTAPNKKPAANPVAVTVELEANNKEGRKSSYMLTSNISIVDSDYFLLVNIDGTVYEYYQYGFNGTVPPDPNDISMANCSYSDDDKLSMVGVHSVNGSELKESFAIVISQPSESTLALECFSNEGNDEVEFVPGPMTPSYHLDLEKRALVNSVCNRETGCSEFVVTLLEYSGTHLSEVHGDFSGILHENPVGYSVDCKSTVPHTVSGQFRLVMIK